MGEQQRLKISQTDSYNSNIYVLSIHFHSHLVLGFDYLLSKNQDLLFDLLFGSLFRAVPEMTRWGRVGSPLFCLASVILCMVRYGFRMGHLKNG